jgi:hypothetical protein
LWEHARLLQCTYVHMCVYKCGSCVQATAMVLITQHTQRTQGRGGAWLRTSEASNFTH